MAFTTLGLAAPILEGVRAMGYTEPTPIQLRAVPLILSGKDVIGSAQTGTGKTAAFALPILSKLDKSATPGPRVLVLEPTRELAAQVETSFRALARFTDLRVGLVYGGVGYGQQTDDLKRGVDVLVATPGRLLDHMQRGTARLDHVQFLVLDEADRMLDMGFLPDVRRIVERVPKTRQTCLFSATVPPDIASLIKWAMHEPEVIEIGSRRSPAETVKHVIYPVEDEQKSELLLSLLDQMNWESVIVFCRTRHGADRIGNFLRKHNHSVATLHSDRTQREREDALKGFRDGRFDVLVATDIAARGLDVADVSHVINYDVPTHPEDYVHRIGRTGRANTTGDAYTLMCVADRRHVADIERFIGRRIEQTVLEGFAYEKSVLFAENGKPRPAKKVLGVFNRSGRTFRPKRRR
ncbi:MAG: DEAD/DEAH box helicase [Verrucomicrobiota bacterium]